MAFNLQALNEQQSKKAQQLTEKNYADAFLKYEKMMAAKEKTEIVFTRSDKNGDLYTQDEKGVVIILPIESLQETDLFYDPRERGNYIGIRTLEVVIERIDRDNGKVYCKSGHITPNIVMGVKRTLDAYLEERAIRRKNNEPLPEPVEVYGNIVGVNQLRDTAFVRLFNQDIKGYIKIDQWTSQFYPYFPEGFEQNDVPIKFDVIGARRMGSERMYTLSTRRFPNMDFERISNEMLSEDDVIVVECIDTTDRRRWWGKEINSSIPLMGRYTDKFPMRPGTRYNCKVKVYEGKYQLVPFKVIANKGQFGGEYSLTAEEMDEILAEIRKRKAAEEEEKKKQSEAALEGTKKF